MWQYIDPLHPNYQAGNPYEDSIHNYYTFIDERIGRLLEMLPDEASVIVMSDHGAQAMQGGICINDWLIEQGDLVLLDKPAGVASLELCEIDWSRTKVWGAGGYYGRLFLNVQGREPEGVIPASQVAAYKRDITARLEAITNPEGENIGTRVYDPHQVYVQVNNIPPDLLIYFGDLAWRSIGSVGNPAIHVHKNDAGPDGANHAQQGMYIMVQPSAKVGGESAHSWRAVCPTMLEILGLDAPLKLGEERLWQET
jgi:predicted AlkP superfamily phosphohydrolase/phosphomutase